MNTIAESRTFYGIQESAAELAGEAMQGLRVVKGSALDLDDRAGRFHIGADFIACPESARRSAGYYGGLQYCDPDNVQSLGGWVIYSDDDPRIYEALEALKESDNEQKAEG